MKNDICFKIIIMLVIISAFALIVIGWNKDAKDAYENGYKDACIDFYKGQLKMKLIDNPDGTRVWKKIK